MRKTDCSTSAAAIGTPWYASTARNANAMRRADSPFQYGSAGSARSLRSATTLPAILNAGNAACPAKYPASARNGIAASITRNRTTAPPNSTTATKLLPLVPYQRLVPG